MKRFIIILLAFTIALAGCAHDFSSTAAAPTYGHKNTGDQWTAQNHDELYDSVAAIYAWTYADIVAMWNQPCSGLLHSDGSCVDSSGLGESATFENLSANGDVGTGADQVAVGNHAHADYQTTAGMPTAVPANEADPLVDTSPEIVAIINTSPSTLLDGETMESATISNKGAATGAQITELARLTAANPVGTDGTYGMEIKPNTTDPSTWAAPTTSTDAGLRPYTGGGWYWYNLVSGLWEPFGTGSGATSESELESNIGVNVFTENDGALDDDDVTDDNVESMATAGTSGTAPVSDGAGGLVMTDIATQAELDATGNTLWTTAPYYTNDPATHPKISGDGNRFYWTSADNTWISNDASWTPGTCTYEATESSCSDSCDNDRDGLTDGSDSDCGSGYAFNFDSGAADGDPVTDLTAWSVHTAGDTMWYLDDGDVITPQGSSAFCIVNGTYSASEARFIASVTQSSEYGVATIYLYPSSSMSGDLMFTGFLLANETDYITNFQIQSTGAIRAYNGAWTETLATATQDTWNKVEIQFDNVSNTFKLRVNEGTASSSKAYYTNGDVGTVMLRMSGSPGQNTVGLDTITFNSYSSSQF